MELFHHSNCERSELSSLQLSPAYGFCTQVRAGPQGFLSILETQLGLSVPNISPAGRMVQYHEGDMGSESKNYTDSVFELKVKPSLITPGTLAQSSTRSGRLMAITF